MDQNDVRSKVEEILRRSARKELKTGPFAENLRIAEDLGLNSADMIDAVLDVEEQWGLTIADDEIESFQTIGDLVSLVNQKIASPSSPAVQSAAE